MSTGLYRVSQRNNNGKIDYKYQIRNKLVHKELTSKNILQLKTKVEAYGFLWGIINLEEAKQLAQQTNTNVKDFEGKYGIHVE